MSAFYTTTLIVIKHFLSIKNKQTNDQKAIAQWLDSEQAKNVCKSNHVSQQLEHYISFGQYFKKDILKMI